MINARFRIVVALGGEEGKLVSERGLQDDQKHDNILRSLDGCVNRDLLCVHTCNTHIQKYIQNTYLKRFSTFFIS